MADHRDCELKCAVRKLGVPQGSIWFLLVFFLLVLFIICMNDLSGIDTTFDYFLFADDLTIACTPSYLEVACTNREDGTGAGSRLAYTE